MKQNWYQTHVRKIVCNKYTKYISKMKERKEERKGAIKTE